MSWSRNQVRSLINEIKKHPCLYAVKTKQYVNKHLRQKALESIKKALAEEKPDVQIGEIKTKFAGLKSTFYVEYKKYQQSIKSGTGEDDIYYPSLWYFDEMKFILDYIEPRTANDCLNETHAEMQEGLSNNSYESEDEQQESCVYIVDDNTGILRSETPPPSDDARPVSSNSHYSQASSAPKYKKRKDTAGEDKIIKAATETLNNIATKMQTTQQDVNSSANDNQILANFIVSKLNKINNKKVRLDAEENITKILYDAIRQCE